MLKHQHAAELAATRKMAKYTDMPPQLVFHPIAVEMAHSLVIC